MQERREYNQDIKIELFIENIELFATLKTVTESDKVVKKMLGLREVAFLL